MVEGQKCIFCDAAVFREEANCSNCGYLLRQSFPAAGEAAAKEYNYFAEGVLVEKMGKVDKIDSKPGSGKGCLGPLFKILLLLILIGLILLFLFFSEFSPFVIVDESVPPDLNDSEDPEPESHPGNDRDEQIKAEDHQPDPELPGESADEQDQEEQEAEEPDYDLLEPALEEWLLDRLDDTHVTLIPEEEMDQLEDDFFADYDPEEDSILVYRVEQREDLMVNVYFGLPFSEWTRRTVFTWDGSAWIFIQEIEL